MGRLLWQPSEDRIKNSNIYRFMGVINEKFNQNFVDYSQLYQWSIDNIPDFWAVMWDFAQIKASRPYEQVVDDITKMPGARWFREQDSILRKTFFATGTIMWPSFSKVKAAIRFK